MKDKDRSSRKKVPAVKCAPGSKRIALAGKHRDTTVPQPGTAHERAQTEEALRESESRTRTVVDALPIGMHLYRLEPDDRLIFIGANPAADKILGVDNKAFVGKTIEEAFPSLKATDVPSHYRDVAARGAAWQTESLEYHEGEIHGAFEVHAFQTSPNTMAVAFEDITERKRTESALKQNEEKFRRLYHETPVLLHSIDRDARVVDVNDYWLKVMGYERSEVIGSKITDFYTEASRKYAQEVVQPAFFRDGIVRDVPYQFVKKNGEIVDVLLSATAERDEAGNVVRSQAVTVDMTHRKRAEEALRVSEEKYRSLFDNSEIAMFRTRLDGSEVLDVNQKWLDLVGLTREEALGKPSTIVWRDPKERDRMVRLLIADGSVSEFEFTMLNDQKDIRHCVTSLTLYREQGVLEGSIADITERKLAEQEIREKEQKYRVLFESANDGIFIQNAAGFIDCNQRGAEMYGLPKEMIMGRSPGEFAPERQPDGRLSSEVAGEKIQAAMSGVPQIFEWQSLRADGTPFDVEITLSRLELGGSMYLQSIVRDISERKRAEQALRSSEVRFRSLIEHASMGILVADRETRQIMYANPEICRLLDYGEREMRGLNAMDLAVPAEASMSAEGFQAHAAGTLRTTERTFRRKDGSSVRLSINSVPVDYDGRPCMVGFFTDISEKLLLEEERLKTQKLESLGTLAGGIAHDFNNLLQGVFGFISMARLTYDRKEKSLAMLARAEQALHQSVNLTSQLLTFSKGGKPVKKVFELRPLIENSAAFALSGSSVTCELNIADGLASVEADEGQIGQVIQNIVLNADQAMPLGGTIVITVRNIAAEAIVPPVDLQGSFVEISIRDQGTGIPAEHLTRIFDPYFTTKEKGSGLGLASVYSIIKNHGGLVRVQSETGGGTIFVIYLPASDSTAIKPKSEARPAATRKAKILVMDDEEMIRAVAGELLTAFGHEVAFAESGEVAVKAYQAALEAGTRFDVVILDLTVRGGMGGVETLRKLVEIDPAVKAIVSSGYSDDAALSNYLKQGFQAFLQKPYHIEDLQYTLNTLLA